MAPSTQSRSSNMPPMMRHPPPGTQTCDRYGNVISTRPETKPQPPVFTGPRAPTSDRYGHVIDGFRK